MKSPWLLAITLAVLPSLGKVQAQPVTNETAPFSVVDIQWQPPGSFLLSFESWTDHVYALDGTIELGTNGAWTPLAAMRGTTGPASVLDPDTGSDRERFYRVVRFTQDGDADNDGMPNGWEADNDLNPANPADAALDSGCGVDNLTAYLQGRDPRKPSVSDLGGVVNLEVYTVLE